jgi:hypothetical protein
VKLDIKYMAQWYKNLPLVVRGPKPQGDHFLRYPNLNIKKGGGGDLDWGLPRNIVKGGGMGEHGFRIERKRRVARNEGAPKVFRGANK